MFFGLLTILLSLLLLLLSIPVTLILNIKTPRDRHRDVEVYWLFGLVRVPVSFSQLRSAFDKNNSKKKRNNYPLNKTANRVKKLRNPALFHRILQFASDIRQAIRCVNVQINLRVGLGDPADTGMLWGIVGPIVGALKSRNSVISVEPAFFDMACDLTGSGKIRFYPIQLVFLTIGMLASVVYWQLYQRLDRG